MRKVKIDKNNKVSDEKGGFIFCPLSNAETDVTDCYSSCAWFRIVENREFPINKEMVTKKAAYCSDKLIGEIVE